jgi:hypothetical protein
MSKARNIADLLDSNGDVQADALDNVATPPSDKLTLDFPVASGGSVTALNAVSINASGEVGEYPLQNSYGTKNNVPSNIDYLITSLNNSRAIWVEYSTYTTTNITFTIKGAALDSDGVATHGTSFDTGSYTGGNETLNSQASVGFTPLSDTKFLARVAYRYYSGGGRGRAVLWILEVDPNGNISVLTSKLERTGPTATEWYYGNVGIGYYGSYNGVHTFNVVWNSTNREGYIATYNESNNSLSWARDDDALNVGGSYIINNGSRVWHAYENTYYYANVSGNSVSAPTILSANLPLYSSGGKWYFVGNNEALVWYINTANERILSKVDINYTTGVITLVDSVTIDTTGKWGTGSPTVIVSGNTDSYLAVTNNIITPFKVTNGSFEVDSSGNLAFGPLDNLPDYSSNIANIRVVSTDKYSFNYTDTTSNEVINTATINAYTPQVFNTVGIAKESASSGSVDLTVGGIVGGYTGLTPSATYYLVEPDLDGTITTAAGNYPIGRAISTTELLLTFN